MQDASAVQLFSRQQITDEDRQKGSKQKEKKEKKKDLARTTKREWLMIKIHSSCSFDGSATADRGIGPLRRDIWPRSDQWSCHPSR